MTLVTDTIFAASHEGFILPGSVSPFGDSRDVLINGVNQNLAATTNVIQRGRSLVGNVVVGGNSNDYLTAYNPLTSGIDALAGGRGADTFVAGDRLGIHYLNPGGVLVADYNFYEGDIVQLSSLGYGNYTQRQADFGLGGSTLDTGVFYGNKLVMILSDAPLVRFIYN
jgi:hypothetical protein